MFKRSLVSLGMLLFLFSASLTFAGKKTDEKYQKAKEEAENRIRIISSLKDSTGQLIFSLENGIKTTEYKASEVDRWLKDCFRIIKAARSIFSPEKHSLQTKFLDKYEYYLETTVKKDFPNRNYWQNLLNGLKPFHKDLKNFWEKYPIKQPKK